MLIYQFNSLCNENIARSSLLLEGMYTELTVMDRTLTVFEILIVLLLWKNPII